MSDSDRSREIVEEMIRRLRELQGSGEFPPLGRKIIAGEGLAGGGTLEADVTLSLSPAAAEIVDAVEDAGGVPDLVTEEELRAAVAPLAVRSAVAPRVVYRDFTVVDPPSAPVSSPPLRVDAACTLTRVSVSVGSPGTRPVAVTVNGRAVTVPRGAGQATAEAKVALRPGETLRAEVSATDAAGIVVSARLEEPGVL